jgi:hypothetical protein
LSDFGPKTTQADVEMFFHGSYPFIDKVVAQGALSLGLYGRAAKCHLLDTWADCTNVLEVTAGFTYERTTTYKGTLTALLFELEFGLYPRGGQTDGSFALVELYDAVADAPLSESTRQWLALLSGVKYGLTITLAKVVGVSGIDKFEIVLTGELQAKNLPPDAEDDLVDGNCNVVCQYLHKALGAEGKATLTGSLTIEAGAVTVALEAAIANAELVLSVGDGGSPDVTLKNLGFKVSFTSKPVTFDMQLKADIDVNDNLKLTGGIGFSYEGGGRHRRGGGGDGGSAVVVYDPNRPRSRRELWGPNHFRKEGFARSRRGAGVTAKFNFGLREPYYEAFKKERTHVTAFMFDLELTGAYPYLSKLEATGELCVGKKTSCKACTEVVVPDGQIRAAQAACQGLLYVGIIIKLRIPGQVDVSSGGEELEPNTCPPASSDGGGWELFIQATIDKSNGVGPLAQIQGGISDGDGSDAIDDKLGVFSSVQFILSLTLGPSRFKLTAEARLYKVELPPQLDPTTGEAWPADSGVCDMVCNMCHKLLANASPSSYIFVKGEIGMTFTPFSLSVSVGAGFAGSIYFPDKGVTLTEAGIKFTFSLAAGALQFEAQMYGAIELEQRKAFTADDGVLIAGNGDVTLQDPETNEVYGGMTAYAFGGFSKPLKLTGKFAIAVKQGTVDECGGGSPGTPAISLAIGFGMQGWNMKIADFKYMHVGNLVRACAACAFVIVLLAVLYWRRSRSRTLPFAIFNRALCRFHLLPSSKRGSLHFCGSCRRLCRFRFRPRVSASGFGFGFGFLSLVSTPPSCFFPLNMCPFSFTPSSFAASTMPRPGSALLVLTRPVLFCRRWSVPVPVACARCPLPYQPCGAGL